MALRHGSFDRGNNSHALTSVPLVVAVTKTVLFLCVTNQSQNLDGEQRFRRGLGLGRFHSLAILMLDFLDHFHQFQFPNSIQSECMLDANVRAFARLPLFVVLCETSPLECDVIGMCWLSVAFS